MGRERDREISYCIGIRYGWHHTYILYMHDDVVHVRTLNSFTLAPCTSQSCHTSLDSCHAIPCCTTLHCCDPWQGFPAMVPPCRVANELPRWPSAQLLLIPLYPYPNQRISVICHHSLMSIVANGRMNAYTYNYYVHSYVYNPLLCVVAHDTGCWFEVYAPSIC